MQGPACGRVHLVSPIQILSSACLTLRPYGGLAAEVAVAILSLTPERGDESLATFVLYAGRHPFSCLSC